MIDWTKLLQVAKVLQDKQDIPQAMRLMNSSVPDNMLLNMIRKCKEQGHDGVLKYMETERIKRGLAMSDWAIFNTKDHPFILCGSKEKAEELIENYYPDCTAHEVEYKDHQWVKKM